MNGSAANIFEVNLIISGQGASPGIASGPLLLLTDNSTGMEHNSDSMAENLISNHKQSGDEVSRLENAIANADRYLQNLSHKAAARGLAVDHDMMEMHRLILTDPGLKESLQTMIISNGLTAAAAVSHIFGAQIERFENLGDPRIRARVLDLYDISNLLMRELDLKLTADVNMIDKPCIVAANTISPSSLISFPEDMILGIICAGGSTLSHSAIIAASRNIPAVFNCKEFMDLAIKTDIQEVVIDGDRGEVCINPDNKTRDLWFKRYQDSKFRASLEEWGKKDTRTADGQRIRLQLNILDLKDLASAGDYVFDGIGLFRTEVSFLDKHTAPDEEIQYMLYREIMRQSAKREVVFRTFDLGGEKESLFFKPIASSNLKIKARGLELSLLFPEEFLVQIRAILRASIYGSAALMFPMVNSLQQFKSVKSLVKLAMKQLTDQNQPFDRLIRIGAMIETPAGVKECSKILDNSDFMAIGSNDLARYGISSDDFADNSSTWPGFEPAVLKQIDQIMREAIKIGRQNDITLCGEIAGKPEAVSLWLSMGIHSFSVAPQNLLACREAFSKYHDKDLMNLKAEILNMNDSRSVINKLDEIHTEHQKITLAEI